MDRIIGVVDYGSGNLFGVFRALRAVGGHPKVVSKPEEIVGVDAIILPGVGAFESGMHSLKSSGLDEAIISFAKSGKPLLGICLGMQFLMNTSHEFVKTEGLGLIPGEVIKINYHKHWPVPNIGWSEINFINNPLKTPFRSALEGTDFYFVHSLHCVPKNANHVIATIDYGKQVLTAIVSKENVHGCQFHPELSEVAGLDIYRWLSCAE